MVEEDLEYEEIREKAGTLAIAGDYEGFVLVTRRLFLKNNSLSLKFDAYLCKIRLLMLLERDNEAEYMVSQCCELVEMDVDWARKNKFKVYQGALRA